MSNKIIEFLPLKCREPLDRDIQIAKFNGEPAPQARVFYSHIEIVESMIEKDCSCCSRSAIDDFLKTSNDYSNWIKKMPYLKDVPLINAYRKENLSKSKLKDLNKEIIENGMIIPKGQVLYSGGTFKKNDMSFEEYVLSTTLQPSVAWWHSCHYSNHISILRVCDEKTVGYVMNRINGHSQEKEVLLAGRLNLKFNNYVDKGKFKIFEFDLFTKQNRG